MSELTPYICVKDSRAAIEWYVAALGAEVVYDPIVMPDGRVGHCELAVDGVHRQDPGRHRRKPGGVPESRRAAGRRGAHHDPSDRHDALMVGAAQIESLPRLTAPGCAEDSVWTAHWDGAAVHGTGDLRLDLDLRKRNQCGLA